MKELIRRILREENSLQNKVLSLIDKFGFGGAIKSVGGLSNLKKILKDVDFFNKETIQKLIEYEFQELAKETEHWGLGEMDEIQEIDSVEKIVVDRFVNITEPKAYIILYVVSDMYDYDYDNVRAEIQYRISKDFGFEVMIFIEDIISIYN